MTTPEILHILETHATPGANGTELVLMGIEVNISVASFCLVSTISSTLAGPELLAQANAPPRRFNDQQ